MTHTKQELIEWYDKIFLNNKNIRTLSDDNFNLLGHEILNLANEVDTAIQEQYENAKNDSKLYHIRKTGNRMYDTSKTKKSEKAEYNKESEFLFGYYFKDIRNLINELKPSDKTSE